MTTPATAEYFVQTAGVGPAEAQQLADAHNAVTGLTPPASIAVIPPQPAVKPPPASPAHQAKIDARAAEVRKLTGVDAGTARSVAEQEFAIQRGSGIDRAVAFNSMEANRTEEAIVASVDADAEQPATAPHLYNLPPVGDDPAAQAIATELAGAMFSAGLSVATGNTVAAEVERTANLLTTATPEQSQAFLMKQEQMLRSMWGGQYESRLAMTRDFLRDAGRYSPALQTLLEKRPEMFGSWETVSALARVAESQQRRRSAAR